MTSKKAKTFEYEISSGAVLFRQTPRGRRYLLLQYGFPRGGSRHPTMKPYWGFPKGLVERQKRESLEEAAAREIKEETGLADIAFLPGFKEKVHYFFRYKDILVSKDAVYFLARVKSGKVKLSREHNDYRWLPYGKALGLITHQKHREVLEKAEQFLNRHAAK